MISFKFLLAVQQNPFAFEGALLHGAESPLEYSKTEFWQQFKQK